MKVFFQDRDISTKNRTELIDITDMVEETVRKSGITSGICIVHSVHSTTAIIVNEHEAGLISDIVKKVQRDFPKGAGWLHDRVDDNADAHLASSYIWTYKNISSPLRQTSKRNMAKHIPTRT